MRRYWLCLVVLPAVLLVGCKPREVSHAEESVRYLLYDPDSAQFRNQFRWCGEVNAKNRMGGYVGFTRYVVLGKNEVIFEADITKNGEEDIRLRRLFNDAREKYCSQ